jgi:hypothetical protein
MSQTKSPKIKFTVKPKVEKVEKVEKVDKMDPIEYCNKNNIKWFPIKLENKNLK